NTPSLLLQPQALKQLSPKPAQAQKGSQVIRLQGKPGTGKTSALKALLSSAALSGFSTPTGILHGKSASLFTLFRALGIHRDSQDSQKHPLSKLQSWSILAEELVTYTRTHGPLALAIDDLPCDSTIEGLGDFLERLGDDGPNILWLQSQREACDSDETAHSIAPLTEEETGHFIRASRPLRPGDAKAAFEVMKPSGGNAREITRLLTAYPGESLLSEAQSGLVLPTSEKGYGQTIAQLPAKTRSALALLYIARSPLPLKILSSLLSFKELLAEESLTPLKNEGLIEVQNSGEGVILSLSTPARIPKLSQYFQKNEAATLIAHLKTTQSGHELAIAHLLLQLGEPKEAGRRLIQVATTADEDQKRFIAEGIQEILKDYLLEEPLRIQAHLTLAKIQEENAQNEEAYQNYQAAGDNESAIAGQMRTLSARGHYDQIFVLAASAKFTEPLRSAAEAITARAALLAGQHNKARDLAEDALKNSSAHTEEGELLGTIGLVHYFSGQNDDSIDCFNRAIQWSSNHQDKGRERLRANLALVYQKSGKINLAQKLYEEALAAAKKDHDLPTQLRRLINLATLYQDEHKTDAALKAYDEALSIARTTLGHREFVRAALNLANLHNH
ncbi:tetratricopeptide repeat protein, partial [Myxococcota bacterium]|nr:tetratricopeptide repeat protein [Myxococcota bacterium]